MIRPLLSEMMGKHKIKSFSQLEKETGVSRRTLAKIYNGEGGGIDYDTLNALCKFFSCTPGDLLEYVPDPPKGD
ncbi:helix-turn-helix transcriptional regulator [Paenibacillus alkaliterrae]|uniref:helix-turn-helix domain-containing protein n=1 Tax=Paenibacillus alkaliterrae TaxID=320909 RepID=UPI001F417D66|nr:helix-turn-helix transcriptional regulator [Paenibacillus alkaliterrae]MCF2938929.1 helix-turn-helix transcriptional regulator [Paenibacillus alkaliterrae]